MGIFNLSDTANDGISIGNTISNVFSNSILLVVSTNELLLERTLGTNIGNMTAGGGLEAAFDGTTSQIDSASAKRSLANSAYIGKTLAVESAISKAIVHAPSDSGFTNGRAASLYLYGKTGAAPSNDTDGTLLGEVEQIDTSPQTLISNNATVWDHVWVTIIPSTHNTDISIAEVEFYKIENSYVNITATSISIRG